MDRHGRRWRRETKVIAHARGLAKMAAAAVVCLAATVSPAAAQEPGYSLALTGPSSASVGQPAVYTASGAKPASDFFSSWLDVFAIPVSVLATCPADYMNALQIADATYAQGGETVVRALEIERGTASFSKPVVHTPRLAGQFLLCGYVDDGLHGTLAIASVALTVQSGTAPTTGGGSTPVEVSVVQSFRVSSRGTRFDVLRLESVDAGASVVAKCRRLGRRCRGTARKTLRLGAGSGTVDLSPFTDVTFKPRTVITIKVTLPGAVGAAKIIKIRRGKPPRTISRCVAASGAVVRC
jgi:hypothetical protein